MFRKELAWHSNGLSELALLVRQSVKYIKGKGLTRWERGTTKPFSRTAELRVESVSRIKAPMKSFLTVGKTKGPLARARV